MSRILNYTVTEYNIQKNIHDFLKTLGYSHPVIVHLKRTENGILKNGVWARTSDRLMTGDTITVTITEKEASSDILPVPLPFPVIYEDEDLIIINKPADMPIHPSQGNHENTLANAAAWYFQKREIPFTYRCINRLDRDTTGLVILAKNMYAGSRLGLMVKNREIHRQYLAIAEGLVPDSGIIDAPIGRVDGSTIEREVNYETGERAVTHYRRLAYRDVPSFSYSDSQSAVYAADEHTALHGASGNEKGFSLVSLKLETGRTHQIRVHMKHIGHPLPGDFIYNPDYTYIKRQALHSWQLTFVHPVTGQNMHFTAPIPEDMLAFGLHQIPD